MKVKTEKELCEIFISAHTRPEHLYKEVHLPGGRADMVYRENSITAIYEMKLSLNIDLLEQCINRKPYAHYVYAVVERPKRQNQFVQQLFSDYGIGIIYVEGRDFEVKVQRGWPYVRVNMCIEQIRPILNRTPKAITLYEENKTEIAGVKHAGVTPFQLMVKAIAIHVEKKGPSKMEDVFKIQRYYGTLKQFKNNIYNWCRKGVITEFYLEKGSLYISKQQQKQS